MGGLKTKLGELRKLAIDDTLGALLVTLKRVVSQGLPPLPVDPVKSTIRGSQEPTKTCNNRLIQQGATKDEYLNPINKI